MGGEESHRLADDMERGDKARLIKLSALVSPLVKGGRIVCLQTVRAMESQKTQLHILASYIHDAERLGSVCLV